MISSEHAYAQDKTQDKWIYLYEQMHENTYINLKYAKKILKTQFVFAEQDMKKETTLYMNTEC